MIQHVDLHGEEFVFMRRSKRKKTDEAISGGNGLAKNEKEFRSDAVSAVASVQTIYGLVVKYKNAIAVIFAVFLVFIGGLFWYNNHQFSELKKQIRQSNESVSSQIAALDSRITEVDNSLNARIDGLEARIDGLDARIDDLGGDFRELKGRVDGQSVMLANNEFVKTAIYCVSGAEDSVTINDDAVLAEDKVDGDIIASKVRGEKLLLTYDAGGTTNLFYGAFNKYGHWDGQCLINTYRNGMLYAITDATYTDGKLIGCRQAYATTVSGEDVWTIALTIVSDNKNVEVSKSFTREKEIPLNFSMDKATIGDLVNINDVKHCLGWQVSYYSGFSKEGSPSDTSGNAFWIKFNEEGKIVVIQNGIFTNGRLNDHNSNDGIKSWEIAWGDKYYYYEEFFTDGNHDESSIGTVVTVDEINDLVKDFNFNFTDKWIDQ